MMDRKALPFAAASLRSGARHPVTLDVPVRIKAEAHNAQPAFIEDTRTALVFSRGAVVPVGEPLDVGQSVLLTHRRTRQEIPCRVVYAKSQPGGGVKGYVELEFLRPAPNFWEIQFPYDEAELAPRPNMSGAVVNVPTPRAKTAAPAAMAPPAPQVRDALADVVTLADAVMPSTRRVSPYASEFSPVASAVSSNSPLVEDIETLLERKAAAAPVEPAEHFTFNLPLEEPAPFIATRRPLGGFGSGAKWAAVFAGVAVISFGAWQLFAGREATAQSSSAAIASAEPQITPSEVPAMQPPVAPEIKLDAQQASVVPLASAVKSAADQVAAASSANISAPRESSAPAPAAAPPPRVVEQGHSAPVPFARAKAQEAARGTEEAASAASDIFAARPVVRVMAPAAPPKSLVESKPAEIAPALPNVPANFAAAPLGTLATKAAMPPPVQGGRAVAPKLVSTARLVYPALARKSNIQGDVVIDALIDTKGRVSDMKVTSGPGMLHQAALESVAQWRYEPGTLNGQPVEVRSTIVVKFRLSGQ